MFYLNIIEKSKEVLIREHNALKVKTDRIQVSPAYGSAIGLANEMDL